MFHYFFPLVIIGAMCLSAVNGYWRSEMRHCLAADLCLQTQQLAPADKEKKGNCQRGLGLGCCVEILGWIMMVNRKYIGNQ